MPHFPAGIFSVIAPLKDCCLQSCAYATTYKQPFEALQEQVRQLRARRTDVGGRVQEAERDELRPLDEVKEWLNSVQELVDDADSITNNFNGMRKWFCCAPFPLNVCSGYLLRGEAAAALDRAGKLREMQWPKVAHDRNLVRSIERLPPETVGMDLVLEDLQRQAGDETVNIVGICGMGCVGKTVLLEKFNNVSASNEDPRNPNTIIIFIELSADFTVENIQRSLFNRLKLTWQDEGTERERAAHLFRVLSGSKSLVLLDNLWKRLEFRLVGIPEPSSNCKIIFTTRMESVCRDMSAEKTINVQCLAEAAAWKLFSSSARMHLSVTDEVTLKKAKMMAKMCGGLPAALITVGGAMASTTERREWVAALNQMKDDPFQFAGMEERVLNPLKLSLPDGHGLLRCALYFSIWNPINKYHLRGVLIGEGVISDFNGADDAEETTSGLLRALKRASLIESSDSKRFKIHPVNRAMTLWVAEHEHGLIQKPWFAPYSDELKDAPDIQKWNVAETMALGDSKISDLPQAPHCPDLKYLNLQGNKRLKKIPDGFFSGMPSLTILDLQGTPIEELPTSIGGVTTLQYLELSRTKIRSLPKELSELVKLRYFALKSTTELRSIPDQVISKLRELRWLDMSNSYSGWRVGESSDEASLEKLECLENLKVLGITVTSVAALRRLCELKTAAACTHWLQIKDCPGLTRFDIPSSTYVAKNMPTVKKIELDGMTEIEEVVIGGDLSDPTAIKSLHELHLRNLPAAKLVWRSNCVENLRVLRIENCRLIKFLDEAISGSETVTVFPNLRSIMLRQLQQFESFSDGDRVLKFSSLETIEVKDCPKIKKLRLVAEKLKAIKGESSWWEQLDRSDDRTKSFEPLFESLDSASSPSVR